MVAQGVDIVMDDTLEDTGKDRIRHLGADEALIYPVIYYILACFKPGLMSTSSTQSLSEKDNLNSLEHQVTMRYLLARDFAGSNLTIRAGAVHASISGQP